MLEYHEYKKLLQLLPQEINQELKDSLKKNTRFLCLKKGEIVLQENLKKNKAYYIDRGSCVRYITTPEGVQRAIMFHTEQFLPAFATLHIRSENAIVSYCVKANENTDLFEMDLSSILKSGEKDAVYIFFILQNFVRFSATQNQIQNHLIGLSSKDFLHWFISNFGFIFQRFSSKDIASFMKVTPTWLSLLKRKISKKIHRSPFL